MHQNILGWICQVASLPLWGGTKGRHAYPCPLKRGQYNYHPPQWTLNSQWSYSLLYKYTNSSTIMQGLSIFEGFEGNSNKTEVDVE